MTAPSHQTIRLSAGRHRDPSQGACVMELASMLAGERFSDHPRSVSPVIAAVLRTYNDLVHDRRRQRLYVYASAAVGTRGDRAVERRRALACLEWAREVSGQQALGAAALSRILPALLYERAGHAAAHIASSRGEHERLLELVDRLIGMGARGARARTPDPARAQAVGSH